MARKRNIQYSIRNTSNVYAVILVGGIGKRLQPLSKPSRPKPFLSVTKDRKTIFAKTITRIRKLIPMENIIVVANKRQANLVKKSTPRILKGNLLLEKASKNTAPAIALASLELKKRSGDAVVVVLPADHYIGNERVYLDTLKKGIDFIGGNPRALVTIGLEPRFPATGYGYIRIRRRAGKGDVHQVERFVEKPDIETAKKFIEDGSYLWNTGTFIFRAATFLGAIRRLAKGIYEPLKDIRKIEEKYDTLPNISVDYAIMEKAYEIYCVKGSYKWEDIGSFDSLKKVLKTEGRRFVEKDGKVIKII
ncbi:MAG: mannose-1-phosphate guanylyltransferase [Candidatus Omnitrophota bacterium]|nr:mannose-1-phosphate guanylyltransferase [Candidatus Omnitrophota bacterium]